MSLLQQAKKKNRLFLFRPWFYIPLFGICGYFTWQNFSESQEDTLHASAQQEIYTVETGDISIYIEGDGNIQHSDNRELTFGINGKVETINVKEGQKVKAGDVLATLQTQELKFQKQKAQISVDITKANLNQALANATNEEIQIATKNINITELELQNIKEQNLINIENAEIVVEEAKKQLQLAKKENTTIDANEILDTQSAKTSLKIAEENLDIAIKNEEKKKKEMQNNLKQVYEDAQQVLSLSEITRKQSLQEAEKVLDTDESENYGVDFIFSAKDKGNLTQSKDLLLQLKNQTTNSNIDFSPKNQDKIEDTLNTQVKNTKKYRELIQKLIIGIDASVGEDKFLRNMRSSLLAVETSLTNEITKLTNAYQAIETTHIAKEKQDLADKNALINAKQKLEQAQQSIEKTSSIQDSTQVQQETSLLKAEKAYEKSLISLRNTKEKGSIAESISRNNREIAKQKLKTLINGPRSIDTQALYEQIENAEVNLAQTIYNLSEAQIVAPISGTILERNINEGESVYTNGGPAFVLLSEGSFELTTFVEEADIGKIFAGQQVYISFDAFPEDILQAHVNSIAQTATIDNNGVVTYEVTSIISDTKNLAIREGMTAYSKFIINQSKDALLIPLKAVEDNMVTLPTGETKKVTLGITNGKMVEVVSGLEKGKTIVIK